MITGTNPNTSLLMQRNRITILLDTQTFNELSERKDRAAVSIAALIHSFYHGRLFNVVQTSIEASNDHLLGIKPYTTLNNEEVLYITNSPSYLSKKKELAHDIHRSYACTMSVEEASQFIDLFLKHKGVYTAWTKSYTKRDWYWYWMRCELPHLCISDIRDELYLDALGIKVMYARMACDEIGIQHYLGPTDDAATNSRYHFNYFISLLGGCFDNLALATNRRLDMELQPFDCSLTPSRKFSRELRDRSSTSTNANALSIHLRKHSCFRKLVYSIRDIVIHREGFLAMNLGKRGATAIRVGEDVVNIVRQCSQLRTGPRKLSAWGVLGSTYSWIEPHRFSRELLTFLCGFVDDYLEILGSSPSTDANGVTIVEDPANRDMFKQFHL